MFAKKFAKSGAGKEFIFSSINEHGLVRDSKEDVLTPLRLFKACFLIAYKMLEEESELFLVDFCSIFGENSTVMGRIEMLVCMEELDFKFGGIDMHDIEKEQDYLLDGKF